MSIIKITANIELLGAVLYGEKVCQSDKSLYDYSTVVLNYKVEGKKKPISDVIKVKTRKSIPATQCINMTLEAYEYMSSAEVPEFSSKTLWSKMSKKQRVEQHLINYAQTLGGKLIDFTIYPD